jgi:hypothetical protein
MTQTEIEKFKEILTENMGNFFHPDGSLWKKVVKVAIPAMAEAHAIGWNEGRQWQRDMTQESLESRMLGDQPKWLIDE